MHLEVEGRELRVKVESPDQKVESRSKKVETEKVESGV